MSIQTFVVREDYDVIISRSAVRELARSIGMRTADQARISLAASSAARALGIGTYFITDLTERTSHDHAVLPN